MTSICYFNGQWGTGPVPLMTSPPTRRGSPSRSSTAPGRSRESRPTSTCTASGPSARPRDCTCGRRSTAERNRGAGPRGHRQVPAEHAALHPPDVLGRERDGAARIPSSTQFALVITRMSLPDPAKGFSACLSTYRRPSPEQAPTHAKAACLYPLAGLAIAQARERGFDNAVMCDPLGNVAELTAQNVMFVKGGVCLTPIPNGTFLNGITRQRVIGLLRDAGVRWRSGRSGRASCSRPTRSSRPATTARSCRACATSRGRSNPDRSTARPASCTGRSRTAAASRPAAAS